MERNYVIDFYFTKVDYRNKKSIQEFLSIINNKDLSNRNNKYK